jgi:hypothetical protein
VFILINITPYHKQDKTFLLWTWSTSTEKNIALKMLENKSKSKIYEEFDHMITEMN